MGKQSGLLIFILSLAAAPGIFGQARLLAKNEFYKISAAAFDEGQKKSRRQVEKMESFQSGELAETTEYIYEYQLPDKKRYVETTTRPNGTSAKCEIITVGNDRYARKNDGEWQIKGSCGTGGAFGLSGLISSTYTVETVKLAEKKTDLYTEYTIYKNAYSPKKDKEGNSYWERKFWLNKNGFVIREETKNGLLEPVQMSWRKVTTYEYDPVLKIETPIK